MKKLLATLLSIILVISIFPVGAFSASATSANSTDEVPEGYTAVRTVLDLYKVRYNLAGNYILMNDIDLTEATAAGGDYDYSGNGWNPIGSEDIYSSSGKFTGIFDGNGYTISGMRITITATETGSLYLGLFANNAGIIKNLHTQGTITSTKDKYISAGGVAAINNGTIIGCSNEVEITINHSSPIYAGGIVAMNHGTIDKCYNVANISATDKTSSSEMYVGGISGYGYGGSVIQNSYNIGDILANKGSCKGSAFAGGIQGITKNGSSYSAASYVRKCYNLGTVTAKAYTDYYRRYAITVISIIKGSTKYANVEDCYYLSGTGDSYSGTTELIPDQTLMPSAYAGFDFIGIWEQNSNAIYEYPQLKDNIQDNRDLVSAEIYTLPNKIVFTKWDEFEVEGCTLKFTFTNADTEYITVTKDMVSGYDMNTVGKQTLTIKANRRELTYDINILEKDFNPIYTVLDLYNIRNDLTANYILMNDIDLTEATAEGGDYDYGGNGWNPIGSDDIYGKAGAFTGVFDGNGYTISGMRITDTATLPSGTGSLYLGLFANNAGTIKNLHIQGTITSTKDKYISAGGVAAINNGTIIGCSNEVEITINHSSGPKRMYAGGIAAGNYGTIDKCYNDANISVIDKHSTSYGGFEIYVGGISGYGYAGSIIQNSYNVGTVLADRGTYKVSTYAGGIQGYTSGTSSVVSYVRKCYNLGTVIAKSGFDYCNAITYLYSSAYTVAADCYYLAGTGDSCTGATSLSAALLKEPSVLKSFDFENIWTMSGEPDYDYPELLCFALSGNLGIKGNVAYLSTVEPDLNKINKVDDTFTYEWFIDGNPVADTKTYTLKSTDIGKKLKVKVTGTKKYNQGTLISDEIVVSKAIQTAAPVIPTEVSLNDNKLEITTVSTQEYSIDNRNWQSDGVFTNLDPNKEYTVYSRILENDLYLLGNSTPVLTVTTDRRPLTGSVNIVGTSAFGDTLTADVSAVGPDAKVTYRYEWQREGEVVGTNSTYTIVKEDINKSITLSLKGTADYIGTITSDSVTAIKASVQTPNAPIIETKTNTTVKLVRTEGLEYSKDRTSWQASSLFEGLSPNTEYTFYQRVAETETEFASKSSNGTKATTLKNTIPAPAKPTVENITNNTVTLKKISGYEYSLDGTTWQTNNVFSGLLPNAEYSFCQRIAENETDYVSAQSGYITVVTLKNTVSTPTAPQVVSATDSSVTLKAMAGYEYSKNGTTWQKSNVFTSLDVLETYTFYQRVAETETDYASEKSAGTSFKVKFVPSKPSAPVLVEITNDKIVVETNEGYQYSIDGISWRSRGTFTGLNPNTTYSVYCRIPENDTYYAAESGNPLNVTTLKNTVNTPGAPLLLSKTANSVTLVAVTGYEYSKNGTYWQISNVFSGLSPNTEYTFYQRVKETNSSYVSATSGGLTVTTLKNTVAKPSAPTVAQKTSNSVTLTARSGYEYSKNGTTWQTSNVFSGLSPNTSYTFYQRVAETNTSYVSNRSSVTSVTTLKNTVSTPTAPILESRTDTVIRLKAISGYEYSKNGTTWQTSNVFSGLSPNTSYTFYQRVAETYTTYASNTSAPLSVKTYKVCEIDSSRHIYDNACDSTCNECGAIRTPSAHKYDNACDAYCNVCNAIRTVGAHRYTNTCDTSCNICNAYRSITHRYTKVTTVKATISSNGYILTECSVCGVDKSKITIYRANTFSLSATEYAYNKKTKKPTVTVYNSVGQKLKKGTDYTVSYSKGLKNVGKYKVTVKLKGNYSGTKTLTFTIKPTLKTSTNLLVGATYKIGAKSNKNITYSTSNKKVATVSSNGTVTAIKNGTATITVKSNGISQKIKVAVKKPFVQLDKSSAKISIGESLKLKATTLPGNISVKWQTSNKKIAKVSSSGKVTALKAGTVTITATISYKGKTYKDTCKVNIKVVYPDVSVFISSKTKYTDSYAFIIDNNNSKPLKILNRGYVYCNGELEYIDSIYTAEDGPYEWITIKANKSIALVASLENKILLFESERIAMNLHVEYCGEEFILECSTSVYGLDKCTKITWLKD